MQARNVSLYILGGFTGLLFAGLVGLNVLNVYHESYVRESYNIAGCAQKYQFVEMTIPRELKLGTAFFVNPDLYKVTTVLFTYSIQELLEKKLFDVLYSEATNDPKVFLRYGERNGDTAVVILKEIRSTTRGEEPIYCVVDRDKEVGLAAMLNDGDDFIFGVQSKRTTKDDLSSLQYSKKLISWGPLGR